jgi:hypothetical protein
VQELGIDSGSFSLDRTVQLEVNPVAEPLPDAGGGTRTPDTRIMIPLL